MDYTSIFNTLKESTCNVTFTKVDGTQRVMHCTLNEKYLPAQVDIEEQTQSSAPKTSISVWDIEKSGWRSFRIESVISVDDIQKVA